MDTLFFFDGRPAELELYRILEERLREGFGELRAKVGKSQISFANRYNFAFVSFLRLRGRRGNYLTVSFGLDHEVKSPRIGAASEPYPNRWTHHVAVETPDEIDGELMGWLREAYLFSMAK